MKWWYVGWIFIFFISCGKPEEDPLAINFDVEKDSLRWSEDSFPISITFDERFSADEKEDLNSMIDVWEQAAGRDLIAPYETSSFNSFDKIQDYYTENDQNSVVLAEHQVQALSSNILATCQLYVELESTSEDGNSYVITHGDIIFNDYYFDFNDGGGNGKYDLKSVFLHELGHFIGLLDDEEDGVMKGIFSSNEVITDISDTSVEKVRSLYSLSENSITSSANKKFLLTVNKLEGGEKTYFLEERK